MLELPSAELLSSAETELVAARDDLGKVDAELAEDIQGLCESMSHPLADIKGDYARLFAGIKRLPAPPWESCYLSGKRQVCTVITEQVRAAYLQACLCQDSAEAEPDDHIGLELQFLGSLSERFAAAVTADPNLAQQITEHRRRFVGEHIGRWASDFCQDLEGAAETEFYRVLARLIRRLVELEMTDTVWR